MLLLIIQNLGFSSFSAQNAFSSIIYILDERTSFDIFIPLYNRYKVSEIGEGAFKDCERITLAVIPSSVTEIAYEAFSGCANLFDKQGKRDSNISFQFNKTVI